MVLRRLIIVLSFLLVFSPVSVAYSSLMGDSESGQVSHCDSSSQLQSKKSCCGDSQCNDDFCMTLQCGSFVQLSLLTAGGLIESHRDTKLFKPAIFLYGPDNGPPDTLLRPPIYIL